METMLMNLVIERSFSYAAPLFTLKLIVGGTQWPVSEVRAVDFDDAAEQFAMRLKFLMTIK